MAKIDINKIENFNELDAEALRKFIQGFEFDDHASELDKLKSEAQKLIKAKDEATSEAAKYKKDLREKQSEAERIEAERKEALDKLIKENEEYKHNALLNEYKSSALSMGYSESLAIRRAEAMANNDFAKMTEIDKEFLAEYEQNVKANAIKGTPKPPIDGQQPQGGTVVTKEQFGKMTYEERIALYEDNPELYAELNK